MILRKMTATFGKLDHETLELKEGLNVLTAPNEWGKSTWSAFLLAMLYGVDSSEHSRKGHLAAKSKYAPWSGKAMSGAIELTWQGQNITIARESKGKTPMGVFSAYDTDTGAKLPWLTAENCGVTLLGVEREVFLRSAFIGQSAMAVEQSAELDKRLHSLASTGEETVSYSETNKRLNDWKNHVRHNKTGYLPETERELASVREKLETIRNRHEEDLRLTDEREKLLERKERLEGILRSLTEAELFERRRKIEAARAKAEDAEKNAEQKRQEAAVLPDRETLGALDDRLEREAVEREALHHTELPLKPPEPECLPVFSGSTPVDAQRRANADASAVRNLQTPPPKNRLWIAALAVFLLGAGLLFWNLYAGIGTAGMGVVLFALFLILRGSQMAVWRAKQEEAGQILRNYRAADAEEILTAAVQYAEVLQKHRTDSERIEEQWRQRQETFSRLDRERDEVFAQIRAFAPEANAYEEAKLALRKAEETLRDAETAAAEAGAAGNALRMLQESFGDLPEVEPPEEDLLRKYDRENVERDLHQTRSGLADCEAELARSRGLVESLGDPAALEARREELSERQEALTAQSDALQLAMQTLEEANTLMQARFSPQLTQLAGQYLAQMTENRYERLLLDQHFALTAKPADADAAKSLLALSGGTAEQIYFALRLAICSLALGETTPLVLDDAFVYFDDERLRQAMALLRGEANKRQILLFTCQKREKEYA